MLLRDIILQLDNTCSILTPTYNRLKFIPLLIYYVKNQDYNGLIELNIYDDSDEYNILNSLNENIYNPFINIIKSKKKNLGEKRNLLNFISRSNYMICFDDDDYHLPSRISHSIYELNKTNSDLVGNSELNSYFCGINDDYIYKFGPFGINHATNGTFCYRRSVLEINNYNNLLIKSEETDFLKNIKISQLNPDKTIIMICHERNTVNKYSKFRFSKKTNKKLSDYINKDLINFYHLI